MLSYFDLHILVLLLVYDYNVTYVLCIYVIYLCLYSVQYVCVYYNEVVTDILVIVGLKFSVKTH